MVTRQGAEFSETIQKQNSTNQKNFRKNSKAKWCRQGQVIGCDPSLLDMGQTMQRVSINLVGALLGIALVTVASGEANAKVAITRIEHCTNLSHQFDDALKTHATATQVTAAKTLQRRGNRYCANNKQAQGIRMLANALKLLGVTPTDLYP
jgi:hypothetical protein